MLENHKANPFVNFELNYLNLKRYLAGKPHTNNIKLFKTIHSMEQHVIIYEIYKIIYISHISKQHL